MSILGRSAERMIAEERDWDRPARQHSLAGNTVTNEGGGQGITARCTCGWVSAGHFSSMGASAAFLNHQEGCGRAR